MKRFFIVDCNNFYVSCERVFNPKLLNRPVVVLSSNDGCVIARSNEAKALGIPMGIPAFQCAEIFKNYFVYTCSSNFALYADMSNRVMNTLARYAATIEHYSIDEAFLWVREYKNTHKNYYESYARFLRHQVKQHTGIPVSIGIGPTKTLAKLANRLAKNNLGYNGVFDITNHPEIDTLLDSIESSDIWGVGYRYAKLLTSNKILTARDFKYANEQWVRKHMTVLGHKTLFELRGIACLSLQEELEPKQSITVSRSFGKRVIDITHLKEAIATYVSSAAEKLRAQNSLTSHITIFIKKARQQDSYNYYQSTSSQLHLPTAYTPLLIEQAHACLEKLFTPGTIYKKAGVIFTNLSSSTTFQLSAVAPQEPQSLKQAQFIKTIDTLNNKWGKNTLFFAASGTTRSWQANQTRKSPCYTTNWNELLTVKI